jgi:hypothetical protein
MGRRRAGRGSADRFGVGSSASSSAAPGNTPAAHGHPLYTYAADTAPGQDKGNGLNVSGGLWYNVPVSGKAAPAATSLATANSGGYGY